MSASSGADWLPVAFQVCADGAAHIFESTRALVPSKTVAVDNSRSTGCELMLTRYQSIRAFSEQLCESLQIEDFVVQSMADVSPTRWHLAHTSWFFETFVLRPHVPDYQPLDERYAVLFNSYYNAVGEQFARPRRGLLSRPTVREVFDYRHHVDEAMSAFLQSGKVGELGSVVELGLQHEQQHQELMLTDIKHVFAQNPLLPSFREDAAAISTEPAGALQWVEVERGLHEIGFDGAGFHFDNEGPRHRRWVERFALGSRLVTNGEYLEFIADAGYTTPALWLSEGWAAVSARGWEAPEYWFRAGDGWNEQTLGGPRALDLEAPVTHVSLFEAEAFATWAGARLATEAEWEVASAGLEVAGNFVETGRLHPASSRGGGLQQMFGDTWEWTRSHYEPYPGYVAAPGALGEYNGKFMSNQHVLRGGSCVTARDHVRATYRNFFPASARWQFTGIRLAKDVG